MCLGYFKQQASGAWESQASALSMRVCPSMALNSRHPERQRESACHVPDEQINHRQRISSGVGFCGLWKPL
ncbi:hypothetical protein AALP_AA1G284400 [Arabis alpina]|uniref:Uncharacterized protein n=1 Tax=Arabis alpina TaxID=50452 RepID=A0A087HR82_ARAAL|nr:hypothetical protein AALP_AA1G284400 [Arabis alpina]